MASIIKTTSPPATLSGPWRIYIYICTRSKSPKTQPFFRIENTPHQFKKLVRGVFVVNLLRWSFRSRSSFYRSSSHRSIGLRANRANTSVHNGATIGAFCFIHKIFNLMIIKTTDMRTNTHLSYFSSINLINKKVNAK